MYNRCWVEPSGPIYPEAAKIIKICLEASINIALMCLDRLWETIMGFTVGIVSTVKV